MKNTTKFFLYSALFFAFLYISIGGVLLDQSYKLRQEVNNTPRDSKYYNGITFKNKPAVELYRLELSYNKYYPFYRNLPDFLIFIITSMVFACIGVLLRSLIDKVDLNILTEFLIIGLIVGLSIILMVSYLPEVFQANSSKSINISFILSFIAGTFTDKYYNWLKVLFDRFFK